MTKKLLVVFASGIVLAIALLSLAWAIGGRSLVSDLKKHEGWTINLDDDHAADGPRVSRTMAYDGSQVLTLEAPVDLQFKRGQDVKMTVEGPQKAMAALRWENGRLYLAGENTLHGSLKVTVVAPKIPGIVMTGAAEVQLDDLDQPTLALDLRGAGNIEGRGKVQRIDVDARGAGNIDLAQVEAQDASIRMRGIANVDIAASGRVDIDASGAGNVSLHKKPAQLNSRVSGIGSISHDY
jgi:hypothetical protein